MISLRTRLLLGAVLVLGAYGISAVFIVRSQRDYLIEQIDRQLTSASPLAIGASFPRGRDGDPVVPPFGGPPESPISDLYVGELANSGELTAVMAGSLLEDAPDVSPNDVRDTVGQDARTLFSAGGAASSTGFRVLAIARPNNEGWAIVALPTATVDDAIRRLVVTLLAVGSVIVIVLSLSTWWVIRLGLRPIVDMTVAADAITAGARGHRVPVVETRTEAGRLGQALNVMLDERDRSEDRLRRFVADASHELRTPLTSIRGYLDLYADGGFRGDGQLDDVVRRMRNESRRMNDLVEDLLLLAKLDQRRPMRVEPVDVGQIIRHAASDAIAHQPERVIRVDAPLPGELVLAADEARLRQVIGELLRNATVHTPVDAAIAIGARRVGDRVEIEVSDAGPGLDAAAAELVFERFYRADPSRSRHAGGSGLGLAIARSIIESHGGTITLETAPGAGCCFRIQLPDRPQPR